MKSKQGTIVAVFVAVLVFLAVGYMLWMQIELMQAAEARSRDVELELTQAEARLVQLRQLKDQAEELEALQVELDGLLPGLPLEDDLIIKIQSVADLSGMRLMFVRFEEREAHDGFKELPLRIGLEGTYHELVEALIHFSILGRAIRIDELSIRPREEDSIVLSVVLGAAAFAGR